MPAVELAHIRSVGMGGKNAGADRIENVMAACAAHARITDLLPPPGGTRKDVTAALTELLELDKNHTELFFYADMIEALTKAVAAGRSAFQLDEGDDDGKHI